MDQYWKSIWREIKSGKTSTYRDAKGGLVLRDGGHFQALSLSRHAEVVDTIMRAQRDIMERVAGANFKPISAAEARANGAKLAEMMLDYRPGSGVLTLRRVQDSIGNTMSNTNVAGQDPSLANLTIPNIWIDPSEAAAIYSQGGIPSVIINKKSKSIAHNGVRIANSKLSASQMEQVNESSVRTGLARALADSARDSLACGGSLLFPFFKKDIPATMLMDVKTLMKYDVVGKNCIERYVVLDRNNAIHIPNWNPTAADFLNPRYYFIPYLGSDVNGQRCARIVPLPQAGYWGALMTMGWGTSDIQGWYQAVCNYEGAAAAVPSMIRQMSLLVRTFNMDLTNAMNGATSLRDMDIENTLAVREASAINPINMDVIGDLKSIDRDFAAVAELMRISRQDVGAKAHMPEEQIWSSDRGAFSSGDQTEGANERQWEGIKYVHGEMESRCKNIAMLEIINALGKDREILKALPYTEIKFLSPRIESAEKRGIVIGDLSTAAFDLVAAGMQLDSALSVVLPYGDEHLVPTAEIMKQIHEHQVEADKREKEKHDAEMKLAEAQAKSASEGGGATPGGAKRVGSSEGYTRLEQRRKEKTRGGAARREGIQKAEGKKL